MNEAEKLRLKAKARARAAQAIAASKQSGQVDEMGFPVTPQGGSSTNSAAVGEFKDKSRAAATGVANGMSGGFGDNIAAAIGGAGSMARGQGFRRGYDDSLDIVREGMGRDKAQNPAAYNAGNVVGATIPAIASGPLATGQSLLGTMGRGGVLGGIEGALHGAGNADGQDVLGSTARGAGIGTVAGIAAPAVIAGAAAAKNAALDPLTGISDALLKRGNASKTNRALSKLIRESGKSPDDIAKSVARAAREGQPEYRLMDATGVAGQRRASGIARSGGDASEEIAQFLQSRQADQGDRISGFIEDGFGFRGSGVQGPHQPYAMGEILAQPQRTATKTTEALKGIRGDAASVNYPAAAQGAEPVDIRGIVAAIDDRLGPTSDNVFARDGIDGRFQHYRDRLIKETDDGAVELSDFKRVLGVKQDIQTEMKSLVGTPAYGELKKIEQALDEALEGSSRLYRKANDTYRAQSKVIDSVDDGKLMSRPSRYDDNVSSFQSKTSDEQAAARIGYGDDLLGKLEGVTAPTSNRARALSSTKRRAESEAMTVDPNLYRDRLARENDMWDTQNRALGGSRTADNEADKSAMEALSGGVVDVARSAGNFQLGDAAAKIASMIGTAGRGQTEQTRMMIARALMSSDPQAALAPVLRQESVSAGTRRMIEALTRQIGREGALSGQ